MTHTREEEISFDSFKGHPNSIKNKPGVPSSRGYKPSVADPSKDPPEVEELARQLAPPIDLIWGYDKATNKALLYAAKELIKRCRGGNTDDILEALDAYLEKNAHWVRESVDSPMGLVTLVARQYQRLQCQAQSRAAARTEWQEASRRTWEALRERKQAVREQGDDPLWEQVLLELSLQMAQGMFDTYLKNTKLLAPPDCGTIRVGVQSQLALEWIENRLRPIIERALAGFGIERVEFEVLGISGSDVRPLVGGNDACR